jgi:prepilin-type processing-associated H-X9-DG protein
MYTDDADDCFPPANEWQDAVSPYLKAEDRLRCPNRWGVKNPYAYNTGVQGRPLRRLPVAARQPVLFETGQDYRNGNDRLESFVKPHGVSIWSGVGHVAYADGHVKGEPKAPAADAGSALSAGAASPSGGLRE